MLGLPQPVEGIDGPVWDSVASRGKGILQKVKESRDKQLAREKEIASKVKDAAKAGIAEASSATKETREQLAALAKGASTVLVLGALTPLLVPFAVFALIEWSGYGKRARAAGSRYVDRRAREYGF